ncbi:trypsin-like serine protease [Micromonospora sp. WMMD1155]|uniref:trypsin-like serine protease n=1 Tax=Micromonospora sp. WMMD1155 TaxID=3016094 RepID=UPI00249AA7BA|nr:trypsin-like serine protease [Micromonospora sp. WMMD1155]WFE54819.1 trypsin-like serine protease [Micromonospora sp. WMMD1155]
MIVAGGLTTPASASADDPEGGRNAGQASGLVRATPAQEVAAEIGEIAERGYRDIFAGLKIDRDAGRVTLHVTDRGKADQLVGRALADVSAAQRATAPVDIRISRYSRVQMEKASSQIWKAASTHRATGLKVYSIVLPSDGRGLQVRVNDPKAVGPLSQTVAAAVGSAMAAADIEYVAGNPIHNVSRESPSAPYPGGIPIRWGWEASGWTCTAAFGVRNPSGTEYLLTAEHCYDNGDDIESMDGDNIGEIKAENDLNDAAIFNVNTSSGVWVNDDYVFDVRSGQYSWDGELVCQSGYTSYPNRCQIEVVNEYVQWSDDTGKVRQGVEGHRCAGCSSVAHGDSGGPVWSIRSDGFVAARGIVSAGSVPVQEGVSYEYILWTEVPPALTALGVSLQTS